MSPLLGIQIGLTNPVSPSPPNSGGGPQKIAVLSLDLSWVEVLAPSSNYSFGTPFVRPKIGKKIAPEIGPTIDPARIRGKCPRKSKEKGFQDFEVFFLQFFRTLLAGPVLGPISGAIFFLCRVGSQNHREGLISIFWSNSPRLPVERRFQHLSVDFDFLLFLSFESGFMC